LSGLAIEPLSDRSFSDCKPGVSIAQFLNSHCIRRHVAPLIVNQKSSFSALEPRSPEGTTENSPAFQRRISTKKMTRVPEGRLNQNKQLTDPAIERLEIHFNDPITQ
jgi:hypothetical protein